MKKNIYGRVFDTKKYEHQGGFCIYNGKIRSDMFDLFEKIEDENCENEYFFLMHTIFFSDSIYEIEFIPFSGELIKDFLSFMPLLESDGIVELPSGDPLIPKNFISNDIYDMYIFKIKNSFFDQMTEDEFKYCDLYEKFFDDDD